jgi:hypothetical protein
MESRHWRRLAFVGCLVLVAGCAAERAGVPVESRPTPPQPGEPAAKDTLVQHQEPPAPLPPDERETQLAKVVADTTAARARLQQCGGRKLLPDQEGVFESTTKALRDARSALVAGDLVRAQSLARQARSLSAALDCR